MVYKSIQVYGQVQGVGYRYFAATMAGQLGVKGWVRNKNDGSVEIEAAAQAKVMDEFIEVLKKGPVFGRVDRVVVNDLVESNKWHGFSIW